MLYLCSKDKQWTSVKLRIVWILPPIILYVKSIFLAKGWVEWMEPCISTNWRRDANRATLYATPVAAATFQSSLLGQVIHLNLKKFDCVFMYQKKVSDVLWISIQRLWISWLTGPVVSSYILIVYLFFFSFKQYNVYTYGDNSP